MTERLTPGEVARLDPFGVRKIPASEELERLLQETKETELKEFDGNAIIGRAKEMLGINFLGREAVRNMEAKLKSVGVDVEFITRDENGNLPPFPYTEEDLQWAKENGEMLVLRPEVMLREGREVLLTLIEFRELFRKDPLGKMQTVFYSFRTEVNDWYKEEEFAVKHVVNGEKQIKLGWSLVKKDVLDGSTDINWNVQEQPLREYEAGLKRKGAKNVSVKRRTATEAVYDELLYYVNTGERLLPDKYDWGQTRMFNVRPVDVGGFGSVGLFVGHGLPEHSGFRLGVCPSR